MPSKSGLIRWLTRVHVAAGSENQDFISRVKTVKRKNWVRWVDKSKRFENSSSRVVQFEEE